MWCCSAPAGVLLPPSDGPHCRRALSPAPSCLLLGEPFSKVYLRIWGLPGLGRNIAPLILTRGGIYMSLTGPVLRQGPRPRELVGWLKPSHAAPVETPLGPALCPWLCSYLRRCSFHLWRADARMPPASWGSGEG